MSNINHYNKNLKQFARAHRKNGTKAEACMWKYVLRAGQMRGHRFKRQRPISNYIVDFMCQKLMLIIEIDGLTHSYEEAPKNDSLRQKDLENLGYKVIRYTDDEVLTGINRVYDHLESIVEKLEQDLPLPPCLPDRQAPEGDTSKRKLG